MESWSSCIGERPFTKKKRIKAIKNKYMNKNKYIKI